MSQRNQAATVIPLRDPSKARGKRRYTRLTSQARTRLDERLTELAAEGPLGKADYRRIASEFGVSPSTVEKRAAILRRGDTRPVFGQRVTANRLPEDVKVQLALHRQVYGTWCYYRDRGEFTATYATFRRQVLAAVGANTVRGLINGTMAMRRGTFEKTEQVEFMQVFSIDLFYLRAQLAGIPEDSKPVGALVCEQSTGVVVASWVWPDDTVTASDVMTLLAESFRGRVLEYDGEAVFLGGVPDFLRCDNGGQFTAKEVGDLLNPLAVRVIASGSYRSHELGAHERKHGVLRKELLDLLPGSENGQRDHRKVLLPDPRPLATLEEVREDLDRWAWKYNTRDNGDGSRMDAWVEGIELTSGFLPRTEDAGVLARFAVERARTVKLSRGYGLEVSGAHFTCADLRHRAEKRFVVRQWLRDSDTVEVFAVNGEYVGTAVRNGQLTPEESATLIAQERQDEEEVRRVTLESRQTLRQPDLPQVPVIPTDPDSAPEEGNDLGDEPATPEPSGLAALADALRNYKEPSDPSGEDGGS